MADDLEHLWQLLWAELTQGVGDEQHGFHWPVACTVDGDSEPSARVVVLRSASVEHARLTFHTDRRSPKVAQIGERAAIAMTFHDGPRKLQVRARGRAGVHVDGELFERAWARTGTGSRRCYLAPHAPSEAAAGWSANLPEHIVGRIPRPEEVAVGRANFAVVACEVTSLDLLQIHRKGHRRARFEIDGGQLRTSTWLQP